VTMEADAIAAAAPHQVIHDLRLHLSPVCGRSREPRFSVPSATVRCNLPVSQMQSIVATTYSMSSFSMTPSSALERPLQVILPIVGPEPLHRDDTDNAWRGDRVRPVCITAGCRCPSMDSLIWPFDSVRVSCVRMQPSQGSGLVSGCTFEPMESKWSHSDRR